MVVERPVILPIADAKEDENVERTKSFYIKNSSKEFINPKRFRLITAWIICVCSIGASVGFGLLIGSSGKRERELWFDRSTELIFAHVERSLNAYNIAVEILANQVDEHYPNLNFEAFRIASETLHKRIPALEYQYTPKITNETRESFEKESNEYWSKRFGVTEPNLGKIVDPTNPPNLAPNKSVYYPLAFNEPPVKFIVNWDSYMSPHQTGTIDLALASNEPVVHVPTQINSDRNVKNMFSLFLFYKTKHNGLVRALFRLQELVHVIIPTKFGLPLDSLQLTFYQQENSNEPRIYMGTFDLSGKILSESQQENIGSQKLIVSKTISFGSKLWITEIVATDRFYPVSNTTSVVVIVLVSCFSILFLFAYYFHQQRLERFQQQKEAAALELVETTTRLGIERTIAETESAIKTERKLNEFLAHEVRNPLSVALTATGFIQNSLKTSVDWIEPGKEESTEHDIQLVETSLRYINELVSNLLDLDKTLHGSIQIDCVSTSILDDIIHPVLSMLRTSLEVLEIGYECDPSLWYFIDGLRVKQIVLNLAKNAHKFTTKGFIRIRSFEEIDQSSGKSNLIFHIEDSGPGIPPEKRSKLFERYQENSLLANQSSGLGLCLCNGLIEAMNGSIRIDPSYNSGIDGYPGTRFVVTIPAERVIVEEECKDKTSSHSQNLTLSIKGKGLIVDDDPSVRKLITRTFQALFPNMTFDQAACGERCLQLVKELKTTENQEYEFILLDHYMPTSTQLALTGEETMRKLKAIGCNSFLFGCSANDKEEAHLAAGASIFFRKPFPTTDVLFEQLFDIFVTSEKKIMILDDDPVNQEILGKLLSRVAPNVKVEQFTNPENAISFLQQNHKNINLTILDENLNHALYSGSQIAKQIKQTYPNIRTISISASTVDKSYFDTVWSKPYPKKEIMKQNLVQFLCDNSVE